MILKCVKVVAAAAFALVSLNVSGQDLLARQAPIDRKLKAVDSVALIRQIKAEKSAYPAYSLYPNWSNERVHAYGNTVTIPDTFRIDMTGFRMPTEHTKITSKFGPRRRRMHNGLDIKVYIGDTIRAAFSGKVRMVKYERRGYGKYVVIRHENGLETVYGHLSKQIVDENQYVEAGEPIGLGGNTGRSTGSHLHFETRFLGQAINPALLFDFEKQDIVADSYLFRKGNNRYQRNRTNSKNVNLLASSDGTIRYHKVRSGDTLSRIALVGSLFERRKSFLVILVLIKLHAVGIIVRPRAIRQKQASDNSQRPLTNTAQIPIHFFPQHDDVSLSPLARKETAW